jgi:hypothetical protein
MGDRRLGSLARLVRQMHRGADAEADGSRRLGARRAEHEGAVEDVGGDDALEIARRAPDVDELDRGRCSKPFIPRILGYAGRMTDLWSFRDDVGADRADLDGLTVEAVDGSVGSVQDVISDIDGAYLLIDTGLPLVGKTVLLPAGLVTAIDVDNESLKVDRTKDEIKGAPDFDAGLGKDPAYRDAIARHYGAT